MQNLDSFWRDYSAFEQTSNSNKELARGLLAENQPKNIDARAEFRARRTRREGLTLSTLPVPPRGRAKESSQAQQWRKFIAHEKTNPFSLSEPDLFGRVVHAFESALAPLYRYPDVWLEYLSYVYGTFSLELEQAASKSNDKETSKTATDDSLKKRIATALEPLLVRAVKAIPHSVAVHVHANWFYSRIGSPGKGVTALDNLCRKHPSPLAYVHFMRAARKHDGKDSARKIFGRARKDSKGTHPSVYVAAAYMEFSMNKDYKVTRNVFEFGLKNFAKNAVITTHYVNWLWGIGDLEYARVVLKKVMPDAKGTTEEVRQLWERWLELEEQFGDVASVDSIERLWKESGVGRTGMGVVHDVLRRSRFLSFEGLREDEMAAVDGLLQGNVDNNANNAGSGGGRRDPRTGRRVASSGTNKEGSSGGQRRGGEGSSQVSVLKIATESLHRMAASMPPIAAPAPGVDVLFRMITDTPDSFSGTPAGANSGGSGQRKGKDGAAGKKRKGEEMDTQASSVGNMATGGNVAPPQDVFRARQAAKQSRLR